MNPKSSLEEKEKKTFHPKPLEIDFQESVVYLYVYVPLLKLVYISQGNELAYIYVCIFLGVVPLVCAGAGYGVVKLQNKRKRHLRMKQEEIRSGNKSNGILVEKMSVREWLHANHRRLVKVRFGPQAEMHTVDRKGEKLRSVKFGDSDTITVEESQVRGPFFK